MNTGHVNGGVEGADNSDVAVGEGVLDVVEGSEEENVAGGVPGSGLDPDGFGQRSQLLQVPVAEDHSILADERNLRSVV